MHFNAIRRLLPAFYQFSAGRRGSEKLHCARFFVPRFFEMPRKDMSRFRQFFQKCTFGFYSYDARSCAHERFQVLNIARIRPEAFFGPIKPNEIAFTIRQVFPCMLRGGLCRQRCAQVVLCRLLPCEFACNRPSSRSFPELAWS